MCGLGFAINGVPAKPPTFVRDPRQLDAIWIPFLILTVAISIPSVTAGEGIPVWVKLPHDFVLGVAVALPIAHSVSCQNQVIPGDCPRDSERRLESEQARLRSHDPVSP